MDDTISLDFDVIREKIRKLRERAKIDPSFAAFLLRESDEIKQEVLPGHTNKNFNLQTGVPESTSDKVVAGASGSLTNKQLEREVFVESLRYEQERYKILVENGQLEKDKLHRESNFLDIQLQLAHAELALKKQECQEKGIIFQ